MISIHRPRLSSLAIAATLSVSSTATLAAQEAEAVFRRGVLEMSDGRVDQAEASFRELLGMDLSREAAYGLWQGTDHSVWMQLLVAGGQTELYAKRLIDLASQERQSHTDDEARIRELIGDITSGDLVTRARAAQRLSSQHGEFAVPYMIHILGDAESRDRRVLVMQALTNMGGTVVQPLIAGLAAPDAYLRRNVALTLGYIGDARACAALAQRTFFDEDSGVRDAASDALQRCGGSSDVAAQYMSLGDAYYAEDDSVLPPNAFSTVVWRWRGRGLVSTEIPRFLYAPELAKRCYQEALEVTLDATRAVAGLARCVIVQQGRLEEWNDLGIQDHLWAERLAADLLAVQLAGPEALEQALGQALDQDDPVAAAGLCRALAQSAPDATPNLSRAVQSSSAQVRAEAAMALATLGEGGAEAVRVLTAATTGEARRAAAVIDGNSTRAREASVALDDIGFTTQSYGSGSAGLLALRRAPSIDVAIIAAELPDMTLNQVIHELRRDPRTAETPVIVLTGGEELTVDGAAGVLTSTDDLDSVEGTLSDAGLGGEGDGVTRLSVRASQALWNLAMSGGDVRASTGALAETLATRPDQLVGPVLGVLRLAGGPEEVTPILAVLADLERAGGIRLRAAAALAGIFGRSKDAPSDAIKTLRRIALEDDSTAVRAATAGALGRLALTAELRTELIRSVRGL